MPRTEVGLLGRSSILKLVKITIVRRSRGRGKGKGREGILDPRHQRYRLGLKMGPSAHCRVLLAS